MDFPALPMPPGEHPLPLLDAGVLDAVLDSVGKLLAFALYLDEKGCRAPEEAI